MATEVIHRDRIQKAFSELETQKALLTNCTQLWKNLSTHFSSLEESLLQQTKALDSKLETLDSETKKTLEAIEQRENSIPERESAAIARVEEQKQAALVEIEKTDTGSLELEEALKSYCRKMDSVGLLKFMVAKRKESVTLRSKISHAIAESVDPFRLILDAMEDFLSLKAAKVGVSDRRWACGTLLQGLFPAPDLDGKTPSVAGSIAERAGNIAESWKGKMDNQEGDDMGPAEAAMFLQMVVGFGLKSKFDKEFLKKLVLGFPSRREMPKLAAALGFGEKIGDIIDELVKSGKEIEAVDFACESGLTERFPPVSLLRSYLRNSRKNANTMLKNGHYNAAATESASNLELNSLKAIIRCVEEHKLESEFTLESLRKRVTQLEKARVDKRKSVAVGNKPQNKRSRGGGGGGGGGGPAHFRSAKAGRGTNPYPSYGRRNQAPPVHHQHPAAGYSGPYSYPNQPMYDVPPSTSYTGSFGGGHSRSPAPVPQTYPYKPEDMAVGGVARPSAASYPAQPPSYGGYDYGSGAPATYQPSFPQ
ncbi:Frigida-like [Macleaya cordata]|uniref:FRIGIDA-like protein n=1 Tax=Macleaya cordata TaxID=56857 RepID=A0A200PNY5_MACCD|nr:Frigida-like [Macleaya cordata]